MNATNWFTPGKIITLVILGVLAFAGLWLYGSINETRNTGVSSQNGLNAGYKSNQNYLSAYESGFYETIGVANLKSAKMDKILSDAVKGRYDGKTSAQPGTGMMFSAITEAYPNIDLSLYDKINDYIKAGRAGYRNKQDVLLAQINSFDNWRQEGIVRHVIVGWFGFPDKNLIACAGPTDCKYGAEALERMRNIVLTEGTENAYKTSKMAPLTVPKD